MVTEIGPICLDAPVNKGRLRRSSSRMSTSSYADVPETLEICGEATLCFDESGSCFQGVIAAEDRSNYSIVGKKTVRTKISDGESPCCCNNPDQDVPDDSGIPVSYDIRIKDHDNPMEEYQLRSVHGRNGQSCSFSCTNIKFTSQTVHIGHKADLIAQRCLGHRMEGGKSQVYCGPISVTVSTREQPRHWVL